MKTIASSWHVPLLGRLLALVGPWTESVPDTPPQDAPPATKRFCLALDLKDDPTLISQYVHWHRNEYIWPEIPRGIREVGILDMEIYLLGTRLFMIMETVPAFDMAKDMARLSGLPRQKEWEVFVAAFQQSLPGAAPGQKWIPMDRIFKLP